MPDIDLKKMKKLSKPIKMDVDDGVIGSSRINDSVKAGGEKKNFKTKQKFKNQNQKHTVAVNKKVLANANSKTPSAVKRKGDAAVLHVVKKPKLDSGEKNKGAAWKETKKLRKQGKKNYELSNNIKHIWEEMRKIDLPVTKRKELSSKLYETIKGRTKELIFAHDTSRVIQCLMKYGMQEQKDALFHELKDSIVFLLKSKYAKFYVRRLFKYGTTEQKNYVFQQLSGHARELLVHRESADIIELAYSDYANAQQRAILINEFYGPSFAIFKRDRVDMKNIMEQEPEKRDSIMRNMKESLQSLIDKSILEYSIVHRLFVDFFTIATPSLRTEMIESIRESLVHMLHTRDGSRLTMKCIWFGSTKDRKLIVKSFKTFVTKICKDEYGHLVLLALFDSVDDTKLVQKAILDEFLKNIAQIASDQYGRKVVHYLLAPRDALHFCPDIVSILQEGDGNPFSKKETSVRRKELLDYVSLPLVSYVAQHIEDLALDNNLLLLIVSVISHVTCDPSDAMRAVANLAAQPYVPNETPNHLVESAAGHLTLKHLIQNDSNRIKSGEQILFSNILLDTVPSDSLRSWTACNRGCFAFITLLELNHKDITSRVQKELGKMKKSLSKMSIKGAQILANKL